MASEAVAYLNPPASVSATLGSAMAERETLRAVALIGSGLSLIGPFLPFTKMSILRTSVNLEYFHDHRPFVLGFAVASLVLIAVRREAWLMATGAGVLGFVVYDVFMLKFGGRGPAHAMPVEIGAFVLLAGAAMIFFSGLSATARGRR